jgi:hypothetical protein
MQDGVAAGRERVLGFVEVQFDRTAVFGKRQRLFFIIVELDFRLDVFFRHIHRSINQSSRANTESINDTTLETLSDSEPINCNIAINSTGREPRPPCLELHMGIPSAVRRWRHSPMLSEGSQ